jgi:hypothetical protein
MEAAFQTLKEAQYTTPILASPQAGERFIVDTDASYVGIGGVLYQVQGGQKRVIAYWSKPLNNSERNYCVTRLNCWSSWGHWDISRSVSMNVVPPANRPLSVNLTDELQETRGTNSPLDSAPTTTQLHFQSPPKPEAQQCRCFFAKAMPRRAPTPLGSVGSGRSQAATSYLGRKRRRLGPRFP